MVKTVLQVEGMMCGMCEAHVNDAIRANFSVKKVKSSRKKGRTMIVSESEIDVEKAKEVISSLGYDVIGATRE